jgi:acyl transferase domain-containing protein/SAM-dependent methyltransferase/acyl carrier protein
MLDVLIRYSHGFVSTPVVVALRSRRVFEMLANGGMTACMVAAATQANPGHMAAALDLLTALGWLAIEPDGVLRLLDTAYPELVPDALLEVYACNWSPPDKVAIGLLQRFAPQIARGWGLEPMMAQMLSGPLVLPLINGGGRVALRDGTASGPLLDCLVGLGWASPSGEPTALGAFVVERGPATGAVTSYAALLRGMDLLLFGDPQAVMQRTSAGSERHVDRAVNVVASGFQHGRYFDDLEQVLAALLDSPDLDAQPAALVDMGCGDGTLLRRAWGVVQRTRRGRHLESHPLLLVGADFNPEARAATAATLSGLPHRVVHGDIADPAQLVADLAANGIDPERALHLRTFLDHDRVAVRPTGDAAARVADRDDCIVVEPSGALVPPAQVMQSLVEHLSAWRDAIGKQGILLLEVHRVPVPFVAACRDDVESAHFDAYHAFSGQQLVGADSFLLAAAEAGLFGEPTAFRAYPRVHAFARIQLQHLRPRDWRLRAARQADLAALLSLEVQCWPDPALRCSPGMIVARLNRPRAILIAERDGLLVGALHTQRIASIDALPTARADTLDALYVPDGPVLQLLGLMVHPDAQDLGVGDGLAAFALQWATLTPGVTRVAGVTRCRAWDKTGDFASWVAACDSDSLPSDPTLRFHVGRGARIVQVLPGFRPDDSANAGHGVLIEYQISGVAPAYTAAASGVVALDPVDQVGECVRAVMRAGASRYDKGRPLRDIGLDSADLLELRTLLNRRLGLRLEAAFFFDHTTVEAIAAAVVGPRSSNVAPGHLPAPQPAAVRPVPAPIRPARPDHTPVSNPLDLAIIGLACRFPGSPDPAAFWRLLESGSCATTPVPAERWLAPPTERGGFLDDVAGFDPAAFAISAREARSMDPQQRLLLEVAQEAIEHAGIDPAALRGTAGGIFLGAFAQDWERRLLQAGEVLDGHFATGVSNAIAAGRLAYVFGLNGPALMVNTACSSSLVALHLAAQSLRRGEASVALAGGANLMLMPELSRAFREAGMLAADGRCRPFDAAGAGYARAEGVGLVVMKRLDAAIAAGDRVLAVLLGSAINQDGASNGLTAPSGTAQRAVIAAALADARVLPGEVDAVEAHGTGTKLGDPVEAEALAAAYGDGRSAPLLVTGVKGHIGHAEAAAGIAGLIKSVLALQHGVLPGIAGLDAPNPALSQLLHQDLHLVRGSVALAIKPSRPARIGVSAFGFSGTNAHAVLGGAPPHLGGAAGPCVLPLSARDEAGLRRVAAAFAAGLPDTADPVALCAAASRRRLLPVRAAVTGGSVAELRAGLEALAYNGGAPGCGTPRIGFLFTGQGSQTRGMGLSLAVAEPVFAAALSRADGVLQPMLGRSTEDLLTAADLDETGLAQPAICAVQLALLALLAHWGVRPDMVIGHSIGEIAAAAAAGVLTFEDAIRLAVLRGRAMQALPPGGAMLAVQAGEDAAGRLLAGLRATAAVAAVNGPAACVLSGTKAAMDMAASRAAAADIAAIPLRVSHAFHSPLMAPARAALAEALADIRFAPARLLIHSTVTGGPGADLANPEYWLSQMLAPVRFANALRGLPADILLELGPRPVLTALARGCGAAPCYPTLLPDGDALAQALAALHRGGAGLDWRAIHGTQHPGVDLPPTPFDRRRFWVDLPVAAAAPLALPAADILGRRMALPGATEARWEARLDASMASYFHDHRLHGEVVVPAASHIALALTALRLAGRDTAMMDLVFTEPFRLGDTAVRNAQLVLSDSSVRYLTAPVGADHWSTHLEGRLSPATAATVPPLLPREMQHIDGAAFYAGFSAAGYTFGPAMRGLTGVDVAGDLAVGSLQASPANAGTLAIGPAVFDAALQVQGVWFDTAALARDGALFVPFGIAALCLHSGGVPRRVVALRRRADEPDASTRLADLWLLDETGRVVLEARGFRFRRVQRAALLSHAVLPGLVHRLEWQELSPLAVPAPNALLAGLPDFAAPDADDALVAASAAWAGAAFAAAGHPLRLGMALNARQAASQLGAIPVRQALVEDLLGAFRADGVLNTDGIVTRLPALPQPQPANPVAVLLARTGPSLLAVAQGRADPLALLFPEGSAALVRQVYEHAPCFVAANAFAVTLLARLARPGLAVIEYGGGTGATTAAAWPALPGCDYLFTDVSAGFCAAAAQRFAGIRTAVVDLEREAGPRDASRFDVAIAANVLHALRDLPAALRRIAAALRPDGTLVLLEGYAQRSWVDLTFGLTEGWRRHKEGPAPRAATLLDQVAWMDALDQAGFEADWQAAPDAGAFPQVAIVGRRRAPARWLVSGTGPLADAAIRDGGARLDTANPSHLVDAVLICGSTENVAGAALEALQSLAALPQAPGPVWLVTQGAVAAAAADTVDAPPQAALWGLARTARLECPALDIRVVDVQDVSQIEALLFQPGSETELALRGARRLAARVVQDMAPVGRGWTPLADRTWVITGGFGGLGLRLAAALVDKGARDLVLVGRRLPRDIAALAAMRDRGAHVEALVADVTDPAALALIVDRPRLGGVFHLAGVLEDAAMPLLTTAALRRVMAPKADAARALDRLLPGDALLVLFGSAAALLGNPGQAAHAASNAVLAAVAAGRRARGQRALCVDWGAWAEIGTVATHNPYRGLHPMPSDAALGALWHLLAGTGAHAAVMDVAWDELAGRQNARTTVGPFALDMSGCTGAERRAAMQAHVTAHLVAVLAIPLGQHIDPHEGFFTLGLDSMTSIELRNRLQASLARPLPPTLTFDYPNIAALSDHLLGESPTPEMTDADVLALIEHEAERLGLSAAAE